MITKTQRTGLRKAVRILMSATACAAILSLGATDAAAQSQTPITIAAPAGPLEAALIAFGRQSGLRLVYPSALTQGRTSNGAQGQLAPAQALRQILNGTGLDFRFEGSNAVVIEERQSETSTDDNDDVQTLDVIIVEGERVQRTVFETNSSVTVVSGDDLERERTLRDVRGVYDLLPNIFDTDGVNTGPTVRGLQGAGPTPSGGAFIGGARPRTAVVVDGRPISSSELSFSELSIWDLDQVEAFTGPQTTTNGTNSIAGAVFVNTRDPVFEVEGGARGYLGNYATSGLALMFNAPIVEDELAFRVTFERETQNTWLSTPAVPPNDDIDENQRTNIRGKLLLEPEALPGLSTMFTLNYAEDRGPQTLQADPPPSRRTSNSNQEASFNNTTLAGIHDLEYEITDGVVFTNKFHFTQTEAERASAIAAFGTIVLNGDEIGNEARINFDAFDGEITGVFGGAWLKRDENVPFTLFGTSSTLLGSNESYGVFGEITWSATDALQLTLGGRYQYDSTTRLIPTLPILPTGIDFDESYSAFLPKAAVAYEVTPDIRIGASATRGYNPGGVSAVFGLGGFEYDEESLWSFEAFGRANLFDDRLSLSANAFYTRITDYQISTLTDRVLLFGQPQVKVENAERAITYGLELTANAVPFDELVIDASLGFLQTEIKEFTATLDSLEGTQLTRAPSVTLSMGAQYDVTDQITFGGQVRYVRGFGEAPNEAGNYAVFDLNASYQIHENFEIFAAVNNLFDSDYVTSAFGTGLTRRVVLGDPFEFIAGAEIRF